MKSAGDPERVKVRPARREDLATVRAIGAASPTSAGWSLSQLEQELARERSAFLVADDGAVRGYGLLWVVESQAQILDLAVSPASRRRGLGRSILGALVDEARRRGCGVAALEVSAGNAAGQALYRNAGFEVVGRRAKFYNDGSDAVLMDLRL